ncbi:tripartite motif-containing protein 14 [Gastrophryne carolinensis]
MGDRKVYCAGSAVEDMAGLGEQAAPVIEVCGLCHYGCPAPVFLVTCGHRFCLRCLEDFWRRLPARDKPCPTCSSPQAEEEEGGGQHGRVTRRCREHGDRLLELYCVRCKLCICTLCPLLGAHNGHPVTLIQQEAAHRKDLMNRCLEHLDQKRISVLGNIQHIEQAATELKVNSLASKDSVASKFTDLRLLIEDEEKLAKKCIDDKAKMTLWAYDSQLESCQDHTNAIDEFSTKLRAMYQQPDAMQLIQDFAASERELKYHMAPAEQWHPLPVTFDNIEDYYSTLIENLQNDFKEPPVSRYQKKPDNAAIMAAITNCQSVITVKFDNLQEQLNYFKHDLDKMRDRANALNGLRERSGQTPGTLIKMRSFVQRSLFLKYARCPTFDPDTMHPRLRLTENLLTVYCAWFGKFNSWHPQRFDRLMQIMSRDAYGSGAHYWEVDVLKAGKGWWIGITYPSIHRKGDAELSRLGWNSGSWCIKRYDSEHWAFHKGERIAIHLDSPPEKVGVFLDYESGVLSFFDVTAGMKHLHTFRCRFIEPLYPAVRLWEGSITICRLT